MLNTVSNKAMAEDAMLQNIFSKIFFNKLADKITEREQNELNNKDDFSDFP